jgi:menaquinone reductase, multiheme cytochrome c subunit
VKHKGIIVFIAGFAAALALGWYAFPAMLYRSEAQPLQFSHKVHAGEQAGMSCQDCHLTGKDGRFQGIPATSKCAECHGAQLGQSPYEKILVDEYVTTGKEIPWRVYSRQPDNAFFPHATHLNLAALKCEECHGPEGGSDSLRVYQENRISGYSRDIWGRNISGIPSHPWEGMKMDRCVRCHAGHGRRDGCIECHK